MTTLTTRIHGIPVVAERDDPADHPGQSVQWEVRIAPTVPWTIVPYDLRSTYASVDLPTALSVAQSAIVEWYDLLFEESDAGGRADLHVEWYAFEHAVRVLTTEQGV